MLNIGVICDIQWDNFILIHNKFKKIDCEKFRLHSIYGKSLEIINNCVLKNNLILVRNFSDTLIKTVNNMLKICDLWLIFTNHIEYNTPPRLIINKCEEFNIKFIVISEFSRNNDYYSFENPLSFKKIINNIYKEKLTEKCNIDNLCSKLKSFDFFNENEDNLILVYNELFHRKYNVNLMITPEIKQKLKQSYNNDKQFKNNKE